MHTDTYLLSIVWRDSYDTHSWAGEREGGEREEVRMESEEGRERREGGRERREGGRVRRGERGGKEGE